jgi:hypothetical protein
MTTPTTSWSESTPAGSDNVSAGDNRIRELKTQIRQVVDADHRFDSSGQSTAMGYHNQCHLLESADIGTGADGIPILGAQTIDSVPELVYTTEDDVDLQLTSKGYLDLGSARLDNNESIVASDNAGTGTVNLIKANTSDQAEIGATSLHSNGLVLPEVTSTATAANQISLYSKNDGTQSELYMREESNGDEVQITKGGAVNSTNIVDGLLVRGWVKFDGSGATGAKTPDDSVNVASVTKNGTGDYTIAWDTDFGDADYAVSGNAGTGVLICYVKAQAAGTLQIGNADVNGSAVDGTIITVLAVGAQ